MALREAVETIDEQAAESTVLDTYVPPIQPPPPPKNPPRPPTNEEMAAAPERADGTSLVSDDDAGITIGYPHDPLAPETRNKGAKFGNLSRYTSYMNSNPDKIDDPGARLRNGLATTVFEGDVGTFKGGLYYLGIQWDYVALGQEGG